MRKASNAKLLSRLEELESRRQASLGPRFTYGYLVRRLPQDYKGERHEVITKRLIDENGVERLEWEEREGPDPQPKGTGPVTVIDVIYVKPYPQWCPWSPRSKPDGTNKAEQS
jgi:hypothetical protein